MARISSEHEKLLMFRVKTGGMPRVPDQGLPPVFSVENESRDIVASLKKAVPELRRSEPPPPPMSWRARLKTAWRIIRTGRL